MYAVINSGGKQYRLTEGELIDLERLDGEIGDQVVFDRVLLIENGESPLIGAPTVDGARVVGTIVKQGKGDKIVVFKFKRRKMYRRRTGHRQLLTTVKIDSIEAPGKAKAAASAEKKKVEKKAETTTEAKAAAKEAAQKTEKVESGSKQPKKATPSTKKAKKAERSVKEKKAVAPGSKKAVASKAKSADAEAKPNKKESDSAKETE
jgi:large subunit ribosomal protein L21